MKIKERVIKGVFEIALEPIKDNRGFFVRTYDKKIFQKFKLADSWVQESHSFSKKRGTIRGFHFQYPPFTETKLVRVIQGKILFVILDLRYQSETFGKWIQIVISAKKMNMLYIPKGCAACICTLTNNCHLLYKIDNYYSRENSDNIKWNDPDLAIEWPVINPANISERDANAQGFKEFVKKYGGLKVK